MILLLVNHIILPQQFLKTDYPVSFLILVNCVLCSHESDHSGSPAPGWDFKPLINHRLLRSCEYGIDALPYHQISKESCCSGCDQTCIPIEASIANDIIHDSQICCNMVTTDAISLMTRNHHLSRWRIVYWTIIIWLDEITKHTITIIKRP
jgi:hypothetical protein